MTRRAHLKNNLPAAWAPFRLRSVQNSSKYVQYSSSSFTDLGRNGIPNAKKAIFVMSSKGFSLIEMLIVVFIVTTLSTITVVNFRQGQNQDALRFGIDLLKTDLRKIETDAMSGVTVNAEFPDGGYGMRLQKDGTTFTLFGDDGDGNYENGEEIPNGIVELPQNVWILDLDVSGAVSDATVRILPPSPTRTINGVGGTLTILLDHRDLDECRVLTYNSSTAFITDDINADCVL